MQIPSQKVVSDNRPAGLVERVNFTNIFNKLSRQIISNVQPMSSHDENMK